LSEIMFSQSAGMKPRGDFEADPRQGEVY
jgi:hypothetical protein